MYYINNARLLQDISEESIINVVKRNTNENKRTVIMIDEVHRDINNAKWTTLLKSVQLAYAIVLGVGIPTLEPSSPQFRKKYYPRDLFFKDSDSDMQELVDLWTENTKHRDNMDEVDIKGVCKFVCEFTGGQMYPLMKFCEYIFSDNMANDLLQYDYYFNTSKFFVSNVSTDVRERCSYRKDDLPVVLFENLLFKGCYRASDITSLEKLGLWDTSTQWFVSSFLLTCLYNSINLPPKSSEESTKPNTLHEKIESIIISGLEKMVLSDFIEPYTSIGIESVTKCEDAIGYGWAYRVKESIPNIYASPQVRGERGNREKKFPTVDWIFNGETDVAIELSKNSYDLENKIKKFTSTNGVYRRWNEKFAILNFQLNGDLSSDIVIDESIYHFVKDRNCLYKGNVCIKTEVCKALPSPPHNESIVISSSSDGKKRKVDASDIQSSNITKKRKNKKNK